jgi:hypothetical protein
MVPAVAASAGIQALSLFWTTWSLQPIKLAVPAPSKILLVVGLSTPPWADPAPSSACPIVRMGVKKAYRKQLRDSKFTDGISWNRMTFYNFVY